MLIGYNTNIPYKGRNYHVQTEDSGLTNPCIVTLLYHQGAILRSIKTSYVHILGRPDFEKQLRNLMKHQHREMIKELITGKCDAEQTEGDKKPLAQPEGESTMTSEKPGRVKGHGKSLDDILLEHISKKVKKR